MAQVIITKYAPATNTKGSRVKCTSWMGTTFFNWDCALNTRENYLAAMDDHIARKLNAFPWEVLAVAENVDGNGKTCIVESVTHFEDAVSAVDWDAKHYA